MKNKRIIACILAFVLILALIFGTMWRTKYAKTEILVSESEINEGRLTVYMIGKPGWPVFGAAISRFNPAICRLDLSVNGKTVIKYKLSVPNEGDVAKRENFEVFWNETGVSVLVNSVEAPSVEYLLGFDGTVEERPVY